MKHDVAVVGGGIVGLATAMALGSSARVVVLEAEARLAGHQSSHNSGVIHSGLYYKPGSLKAELCTAGRAAMYRFCAEEGIPHEACGKLVVATRPEELPALAELERRGRASGLVGLRRLGPEEIREREPQVTGVAGLLVPETGIVDFARVSDAFAQRVRAGGAEIRTGARLLEVRREPGEVILVDRFDRLSLASQAIDLLGPLHNARFMTLNQASVVLRLPWILFGLAPGMFFITGFLMWWNRVVAKKWTALSQPTSGEPTRNGRARQWVRVAGIVSAMLLAARWIWAE